MGLSHDDVLQILALLDASDFDELRLETSDYKLHVRRSASSVVETAQVAPATAAPAPPAPVTVAAIAAEASSSVAAPIPPQPPAAAAATPDATNGRLVDVTTPLLGTFYRAPQPGAAPFVEIGSKVEPDTVVGIVEVMKLMSSVAAGVTGVVAEVLAKDGGLVEYGEILMRIAAPAT